MLRDRELPQRAGAPVAESIGIDLAASPKRTSACKVKWAPGVPEVEFFDSPNDDALIQLMMTGVKVGVDCPLGWPRDFVATVTAHSQQTKLPVLPSFEQRSDIKALSRSPTG
jgi:hypothetical protein